MSQADAPIELQPGAVFAERYRVEGLLGRGGMGVVYRARDMFLSEDVALKILPIDAEQNPGPALRFRQEVKLSRRVSHPNVVRVHDIGEQGGVLYMTMEIIDGATLRDVLRGEGRLRAGRAVEIARTIADALAAAHAAEIIHRDLKPSNVLIDRQGRVVLTDFGIARWVEDDLHLTNGVIGTLSYMAPEQATGGRVDGRTDLYSLGVVLYQMLVGERPSGTSAEVAARIEREQPAVPPALARLVLGCLSLDPAGRPESAVALSHALGAASAEPDEAETAVATIARATASRFLPVAPAEQRLAVLPFRYRGPGEQEHLADVLADELVDALSRTRGLRVLGSGATQRFRDSRDPIAIGRELGASAVIDGAVQALGDRVRVSVRLIEGSTGVQRWAQQLDGSLSDLFAFQESVVRRVAEGLRCELHTMVHASTVPTAAIEHYLEARRQMRIADEVGTRRAAFLLGKAITLAPGFGPAIAAHASAAGRLRFTDFEADPRDLEERAAGSLARALERAPELAETQIALATHESQRGSFAGAMAALLRALEIAPTCAAAHEHIGFLLAESGPADKALAHLEMCVELDPSRAVCLLALARVHALLGRRDALVATLARVRAIERPDHFAPSAMLLVRDATWRRAPDELRACLAAYPALARFDLGQLLISYARVALGEIELEAVAQRFSRLLQPPRNLRSITLGHQLFVEMAAARGMEDAALHHLTAAAGLALIDVVWLERCPLLDPFREQAAFNDALRLARERAAAVRAP